MSHAAPLPPEVGLINLRQTYVGACKDDARSASLPPEILRGASARAALSAKNVATLMGSSLNYIQFLPKARRSGAIYARIDEDAAHGRVERGTDILSLISSKPRSLRRVRGVCLIYHCGSKVPRATPIMGGCG